MRIRKLELQGFKSFADRAVLHFGPGISGVVGPNGCGKSNIVDAVRWCIGEQSARSLRGDSMSDVIFAGSASRQGVGFAEVALTFVAGSEPFPGVWQRFAELEVSRRLYKDGQSEYRVNTEKVRLRDIADLFLDTGVGNRLYSFIEQGRIGQIVHARPAERRSHRQTAGPPRPARGRSPRQGCDRRSPAPTLPRRRGLRRRTAVEQQTKRGPDRSAYDPGSQGGRRRQAGTARPGGPERWGVQSQGGAMAGGPDDGIHPR